MSVHELSPRSESSQLPLFDAAAGERLKRDGMAKAADTNPHLPLAKELALELGRDGRELTSDDVLLELYERHSILPAEVGRAAASIFKGGKFRKTGNWRKSPIASNHARENRCWRLK